VPSIWSPISASTKEGRGVATILVADDEDQIRALLGLMLKQARHTVFRSTPDRFDLVITDLRMPAMDGYQLIQLVRESRPGARIICMSGYSDEPLPPGTEFLRKPFDMSAVRACVDKMLNHTPGY
jgi:DNA-binding NtrC family response regulator